MAKFLIYGFLIYVVFKFITEWVLPVGKATREMKAKVQEMQDRQRAFEQQQAASQRQEETINQKQTKQGDNRSSGDYIDFEEVKP
jgi:Sec-independent protein translocase protein TatA